MSNVDETINFAISKKLSHLVYFFLSHYEKLFDAEKLLQIFDLFYKENQFQYVERLLVIIQTLAIEERETLLNNILKRSLYGFATASTEIIIKTLPLNAALVTTENISSPQIAVWLIQHHRINFTPAQLNRLLLISELNGENALADFLLDLVTEEIPAKLPWNYQIPKKADSATAMDDKVKLMYGTKPQTQYNQWFNEVVSVALSEMLLKQFSLFPVAPVHCQIADGKVPAPFSSTAERLGWLRGEMAYLFDTKNAEIFGTFRVKPLITGINGQYDLYRKKQLQQFSQKDQKNPFFEGSEYLVVNNHLGLKGKITVCMKDNRYVDLTRYDTVAEAPSSAPSWIHTNPAHINSLAQYINELIQKVLNKPIGSTDKKDLIYDIGYIHWFLAHTCIFSRGSAALTEMICKALFLFHGYEVSWIAFPDCEALITPDPKEFAERYHSIIAKMEPIAQMSEAHSFGLH